MSSHTQWSLGGAPGMGALCRGVGYLCALCSDVCKG